MGYCQQCSMLMDQREAAEDDAERRGKALIDVVERVECLLKMKGLGPQKHDALLGIKSAARAGVGG